MNLLDEGPSTDELDELVKELELGLRPSGDPPLADEPCDGFRAIKGSDTCRNCGWEYDEHD